MPRYLAPIASDNGAAQGGAVPKARTRCMGVFAVAQAVKASDDRRKPDGAVSLLAGASGRRVEGLKLIARTRVVCHSPDARSSTLTATAAASSAAGGGSRRRRAASHRAAASSGAHAPHCRSLPGTMGATTARRKPRYEAPFQQTVWSVSASFGGIECCPISLYANAGSGGCSMLR